MDSWNAGEGWAREHAERVAEARQEQVVALGGRIGDARYGEEVDAGRADSLHGREGVEQVLHGGKRKLILGTGNPPRWSSMMLVTARERHAA